MEVQFIGKYEVVNTLGRGSMGVVFQARDPEIGRLVAIKTLRTVFLADNSSGREALERFRLESQSAGKLQHANIVTIFEAGRTEDGSPYIVMEYIDGKSLESMIQEKGSIPPAEALHYLSQIASALDYAHSHKIIHRDIKPSNVIIDNNYRPHLLDFGVAKISDTSLTPAGTVVGTPSYMSPEQIRGETLTGSSDVFSFAVMAFETLVGKRPFPGKDFTTVVSNIIHKEPLSFVECGVNLPQELEMVLRKGLSKDKNERYQTAFELIEAMAKLYQLQVTGRGLVGGFDPVLNEKTAAVTGSAGKLDTQRVSSPTATPKIVIPVKETEDRKSISSFNGESSGKTKKTKITPLVWTSLIAMAGLVVFSYLLFDKWRGGTKSKVASVVTTEESASKDTETKIAKSEESNEVDIIPPVKEVASKEEIKNDDVLEQSVKKEEPALEVKNVLESEVVKEETLIESSLPRELSIESLPGLSDAQMIAFFQQENIESDLAIAAITPALQRNSTEVRNALLQLGKHKDFRVQVELVKSLQKAGQHRDPENSKLILELLGSNDRVVRGFAGKVLGDIPGPLYVDALKQRNAVETDNVVKQIIERSLQMQQTK